MLTALRFAMAGVGLFGAIVAVELLGRGRGPEAVVVLAGSIVCYVGALILRERR